MRFFISLCLLCFLPSITLASDWESSILVGLEKAKKEKRLLVVDVYADWCSYCQVLEKKIFPDPEVVKALKPFVKVRIDGEEFPNLKARYQITGYPTILVLDGGANLLTKITGLATKSMILEEVNGISKYANLETYLIDSLQKKPKSGLLHFRLGVYYYSENEMNKAKAYLEKSRSLTEDTNSQIKEDSLFNLGLISMQEEAWKESVRFWREFLVAHPKSIRLRQGELYHAISLKEAGERKLSETLLKELIPKLTDPDDKAAAEETLEAIRKDF